MIAIGQSTNIMLRNNTSLERIDELIILKRTYLQKKLGVVPPGKFVICKGKNEQPLVVQYDDLDADGQWDELVFLQDFLPKEKIGITIAIAEAPASVKAVVRAHVRHRKKKSDKSFGPLVLKDTMPDKNPPTNFSKSPLPPYLTEGPAWENDKIAFRLYFDTRNGKDVFGKIVPGMVMDTIGVSTNNSYHAPANWGMDVLHVGKSLGAGSVAFATRDLNGNDTLIRLGGPNITNQTYEVLADGPVRAIFRLKFDWVINNQPVQIVDETSIWGGQYYYESKILIKGVQKGTRLVTGFADFYDNKPGQFQTNGTKVFYSFGKQSENKDNLGLAIIVPRAQFSSYKEIGKIKSDIQESYTVAQKIQNGKPIVYRFYSGWEKADKMFLTETGFLDFLQKEALRFQSPITFK